MPSLIYITRIQPLPAELAQALESSGSHVKSFGPGEITADECILVMTSEAILAGLRVPGLAPGHTRVGVPSPHPQVMPPLPDLQQHLGTEAALWNSIKAAELGGSTVRKTTAGFGPRPSLPAVVRADDDLGFVPSQAGLRVLAAAQQKGSPAPLLPAAKEKNQGSERNPGVPLLPAPSPAKATRALGQIPTHSLTRTGPADRIRTAIRQRYRRFWQPAAAAAVLVVLAVVLLEGRASILPSKAEVAATEPTRQPSSRPGTLTNPPNLLEAQRPKSDGDFVAEDYTTRFDRQGHPRTPPQTPDLRPASQSEPIPRRIVVD